MDNDKSLFEKSKYIDHLNENGETRLQDDVINANVNIERSDINVTTQIPSSVKGNNTLSHELLDSMENISKMDNINKIEAGTDKSETIKNSEKTNTPNVHLYHEHFDILNNFIPKENVIQNEHNSTTEKIFFLENDFTDEMKEVTSSDAKEIDTSLTKTENNVNFLFEKEQEQGANIFKENNVPNANEEKIENQKINAPSDSETDIFKSYSEISELPELNDDEIKLLSAEMMESHEEEHSKEHDETHKTNACVQNGENDIDNSLTIGVAENACASIKEMLGGDANKSQAQDKGIYFGVVDPTMEKIHEEENNRMYKNEDGSDRDCEKNNDINSLIEKSKDVSKDREKDKSKDVKEVHTPLIDTQAKEIDKENIVGKCNNTVQTLVWKDGNEDMNNIDGINDFLMKNDDDINGENNIKDDLNVPSKENAGECNNKTTIAYEAHTLQQESQTENKDQYENEKNDVNNEQMNKEHSEIVIENKEFSSMEIEESKEEMNTNVNRLTSYYESMNKPKCVENNIEDNGLKEHEKQKDVAASVSGKNKTKQLNRKKNIVKGINEIDQLTKSECIKIKKKLELQPDSFFSKNNEAKVSEKKNNAPFLMKRPSVTNGNVLPHKIKNNESKQGKYEQKQSVVTQKISSNESETSSVVKLQRKAEKKDKNISLSIGNKEKKKDNKKNEVKEKESDIMNSILDKDDIYEFPHIKIKAPNVFHHLSSTSINDKKEKTEEREQAQEKAMREEKGDIKDEVPEEEEKKESRYNSFKEFSFQFSTSSEKANTQSNNIIYHNTFFKETEDASGKSDTSSNETTISVTRSPKTKTTATTMKKKNNNNSEYICENSIKVRDNNILLKTTTPKNSKRLNIKAKNGNLSRSDRKSFKVPNCAPKRAKANISLEPRSAPKIFGYQLYEDFKNETIRTRVPTRSIGTQTNFTNKMVSTGVNTFHSTPLTGKQKIELPHFIYAPSVQLPDYNFDALHAKNGRIVPQKFDIVHAAFGHS